jgi:DNA-binding MarR family transcriptional regulator
MAQDDRPDAEAERTIVLSRKDLAAARRLLARILGEEGKPALELSTRIVDDQTRAALIERAREELGNRRRRAAQFGSSMFGEAAWDMLLALYVLDVSGQRQTVGSVMRFAGTPTSTAKRWLDYLAAHDLVRREEHPTDRRTAFVSLTPKAREMLDMYYSETVSTGV